MLQKQTKKNLSPKNPNPKQTKKTKTNKKKEKTPKKTTTKTQHINVTTLLAQHSSVLVPLSVTACKLAFAGTKVAHLVLH